MKTYVKKQQNFSQHQDAVPHPPSISAANSLPLIDNRPTSFVQRKLKESLVNNPKAIQLKSDQPVSNNNSSVLQLSGWHTVSGRKQPASTKTPEEKKEAKVNRICDAIWELMQRENKNFSKWGYSQTRPNCVASGPTYHVDDNVKQEVYDYFWSIRNANFGDDGKIYIVKKNGSDSYDITIHRTNNPADPRTSLILHISTQHVA